MNEEIRFIDLFSGIGGFRLGLQKARGFNCVWSCDNNKYANQVYTARFGENNHYSGDIRGVDPREIPDFDLLCAGFPCQSFSVAGKGKGFQDTRGTLFFEISRIAEAKRPQMLLLENVKGLLSNDRGQTFKTILQELGRIGYWAEWQVLNSKHHGVPQNRERVFIIGHSRTGCSRPIFPVTETNGVLDEENREEQESRTSIQDEISPTIDARYGSLRNAGEPYIIDTFNRGIKQGEAYSLKTNPSPTSSAVLAILTDNLGGNIKDRIKDADKFPAWTLGGSSTKVALRPKNDSFLQHAIYPSEGVSPTLRGNQNDSAPRIFDKNIRIRRLTSVECERLQGFPDGWTEWGVDENWNQIKISDTQRYKCLGNAVTTSVITFLGHKIMEALK